METTTIHLAADEVPHFQAMLLEQADGDAELLCDLHAGWEPDGLAEPFRVPAVVARLQLVHRLADNVGGFPTP